VRHELVGPPVFEWRNGWSQRIIKTRVEGPDLAIDRQVVQQQAAGRPSEIQAAGSASLTPII
jgi:hypothetical protein